MDDPVAILEQVKGALDHWSLEPVEIDVASQSENIVYKVTTLEGNFALRIHRPGYHTLEELNAEHEWTGALSLWVKPSPQCPSLKPYRRGIQTIACSSVA